MTFYFGFLQIMTSMIKLWIPLFVRLPTSISHQAGIREMINELLEHLIGKVTIAVHIRGPTKFSKAASWVWLIDTMMASSSRLSARTTRYG